MGGAGGCGGGGGGGVDEAFVVDQLVTLGCSKVSSKMRTKRRKTFREYLGLSLGLPLDKRRERSEVVVVEEEQGLSLAGPNFVVLEVLGFL